MVLASAEPRPVKIQLVSESGGRPAQHWQNNDLENEPAGSESLTGLEDRVLLQVT